MNPNVTRASFNFAVIADWQATLLRIADFRAALIGFTQVEGIISGSQVSKQVDKGYGRYESI
jgi:hypothetical protein